MNDWLDEGPEGVRKECQWEGEDDESCLLGVGNLIFFQAYTIVNYIFVEHLLLG